ncbi:hypothetical protein BV898_07570 [Hypsibius exemplaris]|uniref:Uncharacterized protein n=1 Tax=Hypsibius exemplaris TaxID=2072580 RepID=A0A1W0WT54_HYPEX|nr:hypothetical protein BV898_07570 [Hypsibius exemplaris]
MEPNPSFSKPQRLTWNLSFTIFVVTLGTWYAGGFFNMALNVPQTYIVSWIRWVECGRHPVHDNHTSSFILWCNTLTDEEAPFMLRDNIKLNTIWAVLSSTYGIGTLVANFASNGRHPSNGSNWQFLVRKCGVRCGIDSRPSSASSITMNYSWWVVCCADSRRARPE